MTKEELAQLVRTENSGNIFTVWFNKRSTGEERMMNCRKHVKKGVKGIGHSFIPAEKNLICVRDMQINEFRMINLDSIFKVKMHGHSYEETG